MKLLRNGRWKVRSHCAITYMDLIIYRKGDPVYVMRRE